MRRLLMLVGAIVLVDMMFYAAITPLLPVYVDRFGLSKSGAGLLAGSYAVGTLLGALPSGWLATRVGARRTVLVGLGLMSLASLGFAFGRSVAVLDTMRFLQGIGGACTWSGGMGWLISRTPRAQRGQMIGAALSTVMVGLLLGPVLGTIARGTGPELPFSAVALLGVVLAGAALRLPAPPAAVREQRPFATALRDRRIAVGMALVTVPALALGAIEVLAPLELDRLGAGGLAIGATFLVASGLEGIAQVLAGRLTDRYGRGGPIRLCLLASLVLLLLLPLPQVAWLLAAVVVGACVVCGTLNTPAIALLSDGVEGAGLDQSVGFSFVNLAWAGGQVVGAVAGGALAGATSDAVPYVLLAAVCAAALGGMVRGGRRLVSPGRPA
jgi:MFS family permease